MAQPNAVKGEFLFTLGEQEFVMLPSFRNLARMEAGLGRTILMAATSLSLRDYATIIHSLAREPKLEFDDIGELVAAAGIGACNPLVETIINRVVGGKAAKVAEGNVSPAASPD